MSYQVLARKYRPRTFHELVGQEHVSRALVHALDQDRLHHAYLFTGTRGVGKTTIARILARCLNCEKGVSSQPCGVCGACQQINEGRFVDLIEVDAASRTKVEDTRELLDNVQYAPTAGRYKVYLIDEVHMLSAHSFNALLKTLEEPPPHVKFLLATTDPQKLPVTILSRCLQFNLKALPSERIATHLQALLEKEMIRFEAPALQLLGMAARGSMRDALSLTDQAIAFGGEQLNEAAVRQMLGTVDREHVLRLVRALAANDAGKALAALDEVMEQAPDELSLLDELITTLHAVAVAQAVPGRGRDEAVCALAGDLLAEQVQLWYDVALRGRRDLPDAPDPRMGLDMILLRMVLFSPSGVLPEGGAVPAKKSARPVAAPVVAPAPVVASPAAASPAPPRPAPRQPEATAPPSTPALPDEADLGQWWAALVTSLPLDGMVRNLAHHAVLLAKQGRQWKLGLDVGHQMLATRERLDALQRVIGQSFGSAVVLDVEIREGSHGTPAQREQQVRAQRLAIARQAIQEDPVVQALVKEFNGRLDPDSIEAD